jgi:hypothetical protein
MWERTPWRVGERWIERQCNRCGDWWPLTSEFFGAAPRCRGGLSR